MLLPSLAAALITAACLVLWPEQTAVFLRPGTLVHQVGKPMARMAAFMAMGLTAAMIIEAVGWLSRLARLARPLTSRARLPLSAAAAFPAAFLPGPTANAILSEGFDKKDLSRKSLLVAYLLNSSWPSFIVHLPTTLVVASSFAGLAGLAYTAIMFADATLRLFGAAALGRLFLPVGPVQPANIAAPPGKPWREAAAEMKERLWKRLISLLSVALPIFFLVSLAAALGLFEALRNFSAAHLPDFFLPAEAAALVAFSLVAEFSSGFAAAGALIESTSLTIPQATAALVVGNIIATPARVLRFQLAALTAFFPLRISLCGFPFC